MEVLIVEDERELAEAISEYLGMFGISASVAGTFGEAARLTEAFKVCILDVNLPDGNGYELSKLYRARFNGVKILFLSARREDFDILKGYSVGGDDYIVKPCSLPVLLAKVKHALGTDRLISINNITIDPKNCIVTKNGAVVALKNMEYKLLWYLYENRGILIDKDKILKDVWGAGYYSDNTLNVHVNRIREKLEDTPGELIQTVWGVGYRFRQ